MGGRRCGLGPPRRAFWSALNMAPLVVLGELHIGQVEPPLQLLDLPRKRLDALRFRCGRREWLVAFRPGSRPAAAAGGGGGWGGRNRRRTATIVGSGRRIGVNRACDAGPSRGCRAPAVAASMATMEGCRATATVVARSLGSAMATVATTSNYGRRGRTLWVGGTLRRHGHCMCCLSSRGGR